MQDSYWTVEAIEQRVLKDMEEAMSKYSVPAVRAEMRVVKPYDRMDLKSFPDVWTLIFRHLLVATITFSLL